MLNTYFLWEAFSAFLPKLNPLFCVLSSLCLSPVITFTTLYRECLFSSYLFDQTVTYSRDHVLASTKHGIWSIVGT